MYKVGAGCTRFVGTRSPCRSKDAADPTVSIFLFSSGIVSL